jgi:DNA-binding transcriptional regulator YdaS (Cro superfamily)
MLDYGIYGIGYDPEKAKELAISSGLVNQTISISTNGTAASILSGVHSV